MQDELRHMGEKKRGKDKWANNEVSRFRADDKTRILTSLPRDEGQMSFLFGTTHDDVTSEHTQGCRLLPRYDDSLMHSIVIYTLFTIFISHFSDVRSHYVLFFGWRV